MTVDGALLGWSLGHGGELVVMSSTSPRADVPGRPSWGRYDVVDVESFGPRRARWQLRDIRGVGLLAQPTPDGGLLIACSRTLYGEDNAMVFGPGGDLRHSFCIGDGVRHVQVTPAGAVWAGYFDEGIFGSGDGRSPLESEDGRTAPALGRSGIVEWTLDGALVWEYTALQPSDLVADCYALNLDGEVVYSCYYGEFPLVRIDPGHRISRWDNSIIGARAVAARAGVFALAGGYWDLYDRVATIEPATGRCEVFRAVRPDGSELPARRFEGHDSASGRSRDRGPAEVEGAWIPPPHAPRR